MKKNSSLFLLKLASLVKLKRTVLKRFFLIPVIFLAFSGCKKENERPQWEVNVLGPLVHASLGVNNFIADSIIQADSSHAITLVYEDVLYNTTMDSLFEIRDTILPTVFIFPLPSFNLAANTPFYASNNNLSLGISGVELREVIIKSGFIHLEARNRLNARVIYTYTIPKATLNGIPFQFSTTINAAPPGGYSGYSGLHDLSGYKFDLTGTTGNSVNTLVYNISGRTDTGIANTTILSGDTLVNIEASLQDIIPYYAKGYLGQKEINEGNVFKNISPFAAVQSGNIRLQDVTMKVTIENSIGVELQAFISQMQSVNIQTGGVVNLVAPPLLNHSINMNRATESGNPQFPVNPTNYVIQLDNSNSNLRAFIENLPDRLNYSLRLNLNPLGNISGSNDFVYSDYLVKAKLRVDMPLAFSADHFTLADTSNFALENQTDFDPVGPGTFTLIAENGFPFDAEVQLVLLDGNNTFLDTLASSVTIAAAPVDASFKVIAPRRTKIPVYVDAVRKQRILAGRKIAIRAGFTTPSSPQFIRIYTNYKLDLKLVADATYLIH